MTLFLIDSGQVRAGLVKTGALLAVVAMVAGCGSQYRPVITPINPSGPPAQPMSLAVVISAPSPTQPGIASIIDYSGDDIMAQQPVGVGPLGFSVDATGSTAYTVNRDTTLTSFPVTTSLEQKNVQSTTLFTTTRLTGLFTPSTGLWAPDLDGNGADVLSGSPATFQVAIPVAPTPIAVIGPGSVNQRVFSISQNNGSTPAGSVIQYDTTCNISPRTVTQNGEADAIEVLSRTVSARIPLGKCPVYAISERGWQSSICAESRRRHDFGDQQPDRSPGQLRLSSHGLREPE